MKPPYFKALCPFDETPVRQQPDQTYKCPHCGRTIPAADLVWLEVKKDATND